MKQYRGTFRGVLLPVVLLAVLLILAGCSAAPAPVTTAPSPATIPTPAPIPAPATAPAQGTSITINLITQNMAFDMKVITVQAGADVTVNFENKDKIGHNLAVYTDKSAAKSIFVGEVITSKAVVYKFKAPETPGTYFFRCDPHAATMNGDFVVTSARP
jgi:plastocyanin